MEFGYRLDNDTELRLLEPRHAEQLYALVDRNREHVGRWMSWVEGCQSVDERRALITRKLSALAECGSLTVGIWHQGKLSGMTGVNQVHPRDRSTSMFYWLGEEYQGKGLITAACRALISHTFTVLHAHRVEIYAATGNLRSRAVAERLGFQHEGTRREAYPLHGQFVDIEAYALLAHEWEPREAIAFTHSLTPEIELRLMQPYDAEAMYALVDTNRERLSAWFPWPDNTWSADDSRAFITHTLKALAENREIHWSIWYKGQLAGEIGTLPIDWRRRSVEFGYWLGEAFQGKGVMTAVGTALVDYLFRTLELNRLVIRYREYNARSAGVAKRLGFTREGIQRQAYGWNGELVDLVCTALLRKEWETITCASIP